MRSTALVTGGNCILWHRAHALLHKQTCWQDYPLAVQNLCPPFVHSSAKLNKAKLEWKKSTYSWKKKKRWDMWGMLAWTNHERACPEVTDNRPLWRKSLMQPILKAYEPRKTMPNLTALCRSLAFELRTLSPLVSCQLAHTPRRIRAVRKQPWLHENFQHLARLYRWEIGIWKCQF